MIALANILEQGLLFLPLALGIFVSYRLLRCTDLTVDGSFVLGAALCARLLLAGMHPLAAVAAAVAGGALVGALVSLLHLRVQPLLAGILALFVLQSVNLQVMGKPNLNLLGTVRMSHGLPALALLGGLLLLVLLFLLRSRGGLLLRAFGDNPRLLRQQGYSPNLLRALGLALSNGLVALCGAMTAQASGYADVHMGFGMVMVGIGTVVIGQQLLRRLGGARRFRASPELLACGAGVLLYFSTLHGFLSAGIDPLYLKMLVGLALIGTLMSPGVSHA